MRDGALGAGVSGWVTGEMYFPAPDPESLYIHVVRPPRQPYALDTPAFAFAAIATFAARSAVGGAREIALATFVTARMANDLAADRELPAAGRRARAASARRWLSTLAVGEPMRRAFADLVAATEEDAAATAAALRRVIDVTASTLDAASRAELERLARDLEAQMVART